MPVHCTRKPDPWRSRRSQPSAGFNPTSSCLRRSCGAYAGRANRLRRRAGCGRPPSRRRAQCRERSSASGATATTGHRRHRRPRRSPAGRGVRERGPSGPPHQSLTSGKATLPLSEKMQPFRTLRCMTWDRWPMAYRGRGHRPRAPCHRAVGASASASSSCMTAAPDHEVIQQHASRGSKANEVIQN